jgi:hypothetical protein
MINKKNLKSIGNYMYILFWIWDSGYCPDPGIPGTSSGGGCSRGSGTSRDRPWSGLHLGGNSRDPITMEETWTGDTSCWFETWHSRVSSQQSEDIMYTRFIYVCCNLTLCEYFKPLCDDIFSFRRTNHMVLQYMHWSSVYTQMTDCLVSKTYNSKDLIFKTKITFKNLAMKYPVRW